MTHTLVVGFNRPYLTAVNDQLPPRSVVVLEEPDIIRKRGIDVDVPDFECLRAIVPAAYQQAADCVDVAAQLHERYGFAAALPGLEYAVPATAAVATKLGLPGAGESAAAVLRDKELLREATSRAGIRNPRWTRARSAQDIVEFGAGGPVVVKPANRQASVGVQLLDRSEPEQAAAAWAATLAAGEYEQVPDRELQWRYLVEERLYGPEYSIEALVHDGEIVFENVTEKAVIAGSLPIELGHAVPAPFEAGDLGMWREAIRSLVDAVQFGTGMLHAEWILTPDGPALVECAGRCPGDRIADLIDLAYGTRIRVALIELLAGHRPELPSEPRQGAAIRFLGAAPGRVLQVDGVDVARRLPGIREVAVRVPVGARVTNWLSSWDRPGLVIATGADGRQARLRAEAAAGAVRIVTEPQP